MKRLTGETLEQKLRAASPPSQQELLRALVDVCRAIELAHARGVIHRDLKPANIMLGNFGEVYVIDWGVARIFDDTETVAARGDVDSLDGLTQAGAMLGTPAYMAPEQVEGSPDVGPPADVYALGAIAPVITAIMAVSLTSYPQLMQRARYIIAMLVASWLCPVVLEQAGVLERTWRVEPGGVVSMSPVFHVGGPGTGVLLVIANVLAIVVIGLFANALAKARHAAQRDVEIQAWQLRQLLPDG